MESKFKKSLVFLLALTLPAIASAADPLNVYENNPQAYSCEKLNSSKNISFVDALQISLCNNPTTRAAWYRIKSASAQYGQSRSEYFPDVALSYDARKNFTNSASAAFNSRGDEFYSYGASATLNYLLLDFGGRAADVEVFRENMKQMGFQYNLEVQNLIFKVIKYYADTLNAQGSLDASIKAEAASREAFEAAKARFDVGLVTPADTAQAETAYAQSRLNREVIENQLRLTKAALLTALNLPPENDITLTEISPKMFEGDINPNIRQLINKALERRPDLASAKSRAVQAEADLEKARSNYLPALGLNGTLGESNFSRGPNQSSTDSSIGLQLSVPLFTGFENTYKSEEAKYNAKAAQEDIRNTTNQIELDVLNSYNNYLTAQKNYVTVQTLIKSAEAAEELALGRYKNGKGTLIEALDSQAKLADAERQFVASKYNLVVTRFDLYRALGMDVVIK